MIDYGPLWATMKSRGVSQYQLLKHGLDKHTLDQLRKNKNITVITMEKLCSILKCTPNEVVAFHEESEQ